MIKDRKNVCFCAFRCCLLRSVESLAGPGISGDLPYGDGLAPCPQPSGKPWHHVPRAPSARPPDLVPALTLSLLPPVQLPALVTEEVVSMVTVWGASGHLEPEGAEEGRVSTPSQPFSGTQRDLSCRAWQVLQQMRSGWALSFCDFFSYLLPDFVRSQLPQLCASEELSLNPLWPAKGSGISS